MKENWFLQILQFMYVDWQHFAGVFIVMILILRTITGISSMLFETIQVLVRGYDAQRNEQDSLNDNVS
jgi:uncharacterized iron-regulated membrane protein